MLNLEKCGGMWGCERQGQTSVSVEDRSRLSKRRAASSFFGGFGEGKRGGWGRVSGSQDGRLWSLSVYRDYVVP